MGLSFSLDNVGPLARTARDCARLLRIIAGHDPLDPTSSRQPVADYEAATVDASVKGLRIGVKKGGCAGMEYTMEYVDDIAPHDEVVEQNGARVMIAPMAQMFLFGTEIDYETGLVSEAGYALGTPNVWAPMSVDLERELVFVPTGNAAPDYYHGERRDMNYFGSSVVDML